MKVLFHPSQFPEVVRKELARSLRERGVNHKFHYDSYKQTRKRLALHETYSPARTDPNCQTIYDAAFASAAEAFRPDFVHLVGLGCGGGQKDVRLLQLLAQRGKQLRY